MSRLSTLCPGDCFSTRALALFFLLLVLQPLFLSNACRALTLYESVEQWLDVLVGFGFILRGQGLSGDVGGVGEAGLEETKIAEELLEDFFFHPNKDPKQDRADSF